MSKKKHKGKKYTRKTLVVATGKNETETAKNYADVLVSPELAASRVICQSESKSNFGEFLDVPSLMEKLREQTQALQQGDLSNAEAMLMSQATALQSLFARLAERGMASETAPSFEANMKYALKAQSQARSTLEALGKLKNPPTVFAKQANVTSGPQQVNNGTPLSSQPENQKLPNKLSGEYDELLQDTRTPKKTRGDDSQMEAVGEIDRTKDGGG